MISKGRKPAAKVTLGDEDITDEWNKENLRDWNKRTLLIDDLRNLEADCIARNTFEGIRQLMNGPWETLLLDHDMATWDKNGKEYTGYDVLLWIEEKVHHIAGLKVSQSEKLEMIDLVLPKNIKLVTDNSSAKQKMMQAIDAIQKKVNSI